jgi:acetamidase/formamidase
MKLFRLIRVVPFALAVSGCAGVIEKIDKATSGIDVYVPSNPDTVVWGYLPADRAPVARIRSGQIAKISTVSHQGLINGMDPVQFFAAAGIAAGDVLPDAIEIYRKVPRPKDAGAHLLTGPIYIEGAEPGDMLEVRMLDFDYRVPYGVNNSNKGTGVLPDLHAKPYPKVIRFDLVRRVALFAPRINVPLGPFMGIMAVAPPGGLANTRPPGIYGGNMDFSRLTVGASLYLPVHQRGALFYTGDSHAAQGDGEINGTAIEASLSAVMGFIVHKGKGKTMKWPRAEDNENYYVMGMDVDLDAALKQAAEETVAFLEQEKAMSAADAYSLASIVVSYIIGEAVDHVQMVYGVIPKEIFVK